MLAKLAVCDNRFASMSVRGLLSIWATVTGQEIGTP